MRLQHVAILACALLAVYVAAETGPKDDLKAFKSVLGKVTVSDKKALPAKTTKLSTKFKAVADKQFKKPIKSTSKYVPDEGHVSEGSQAQKGGKLPQASSTKGGAVKGGVPPTPASAAAAAALVQLSSRIQALVAVRAQSQAAQPWQFSYRLPASANYDRARSVADNFDGLMGIYQDNGAFSPAVVDYVVNLLEDHEVVFYLDIVNGQLGLPDAPQSPLHPTNGGDAELYALFARGLYLKVKRIRSLMYEENMIAYWESGAFPELLVGGTYVGGGMGDHIINQQAYGARAASLGIVTTPQRCNALRAKKFQNSAFGRFGPRLPPANDYNSLYADDASKFWDDARTFLQAHRGLPAPHRTALANAAQELLVCCSIDLLGLYRIVNVEHARLFIQARDFRLPANAAWGMAALVDDVPNPPHPARPQVRSQEAANAMAQFFAQTFQDMVNYIPTGAQAML